MRVSIKILIFLFFLPWTHGLWTSIAQAQQVEWDPREKWLETETQEARWIYNAKHKKWVDFYIHGFERLKKPLQKLFKEHPEKLTIVIADQTDRTNGLAQVVPYNLVYLFPAPPLAASSLGDFGDTGGELLIHEYTHILNMDPVHGFMNLLAWVFGSAVHPNMLLSRWYIEGLAVYTESKYSSLGGRLNSQYAEGVARSLTLARDWDQYSLTRINGFYPNWLGGGGAYLFGGLLWESIVRDGGPSMISKLNRDYSRRVPYFINGPLERYLGRDYNEQLKRAYGHWEQKAQKQIDKITHAPHPPGQALKMNPGSWKPFVSISPDGKKMAFIHRRPQSPEFVSVIQREVGASFSQKKQTLVGGRGGAQSIAWKPDSTGFAYEEIDIHDRYYSFLDLFFYDIKTQTSTPLTQGERAYHSCFSEDGKTLYYLRNRWGFQQIQSLNLETREKKTLYEAQVGQTLRFLVCWSSDQLLFVQQNSNQEPHIAQLSLKSLDSGLFFNQVSVGYLEKSDLGLIFSSQDSGVDNLYLMEMGQSFEKDVSLEENQRLGEYKSSIQRWVGVPPFRALTNSLTRVSQGTLDPLNQDLYYSQWTSEGPELFRLKAPQWESLADRPPKVDPIFQTSSRESTSPPSKAGSTPQEVLSEDRPAGLRTSKKFSPWRYLYPNYWVPFVYVVDGGVLFQASTSARDPLGRNEYTLLGRWDTLTQKPTVGFSYWNRYTPVNLGFSLSHSQVFFYPRNTSITFNSYSFVASYFFWRRRLQLNLFWNSNQQISGDSHLLRRGPQLEALYSNRIQREFLTSTGWQARLGYKAFWPSQGNVSYTETYLRLKTYWSSFLSPRHSLYGGFNLVYAPDLYFPDHINFANTTLGGPFKNPNAINLESLQRGYPTGAFVARNIFNTNWEYRFAPFSIFRGFTEPPVFLKTLLTRLILDATTFDGVSFSRSSQAGFKMSQWGQNWFLGYGMELELNVDVGFYLPLVFTWGLYYGQDRDTLRGSQNLF